jgi:hypothetical protein
VRVGEGAATLRTASAPRLLGRSIMRAVPDAPESGDARAEAPGAAAPSAGVRADSNGEREDGGGGGGSAETTDEFDELWRQREHEEEVIALYQETAPTAREFANASRRRKAPSPPFEARDFAQSFPWVS